LANVILISVVLGLILATLGAIYSADILRLMGGSEDLVSQGEWYIKIQFLSAPFIILLFTLSGALRGAGSASLAMRPVILANILNIGLDFLLVAVFDMGIKGAALATLIGRGFGVAYQLYILTDAQSKLRLLWEDFIPKKAIIINILKIGAGNAGQFLIQSASWVFWFGFFPYMVAKL